MKTLLISILVIAAGLQTRAQVREGQRDKQHPDSLHLQAERIRSHTFTTADTAKLGAIQDILRVYQLAKEKLSISADITEPQRLQWQRLAAERDIALSKVLTYDELRVLVQSLERVPPARRPLPPKPQEEKDKTIDPKL
ncbi:hypothetical protein [Parapedobacter tibetensis]|uniref:hypothetical protein n=1 Tax=Parapedobacter tibetensis TaxID=2972951 RepID=UPI00214D6D1A|nr:hypothetical protein [Parapedobacter tibetensis]